MKEFRVKFLNDGEEYIERYYVDGRFTKDEGIKKIENVIGACLHEEAVEGTLCEIKLMHEDIDVVIRDGEYYE